MKRLWLPIVLIASFIAIAVVGYRIRQPEHAMPLVCKDIVAGCPFTLRGRTATLRLSAVPKPLEGFTLEVRAPGATHVSAEFQMVGMDMGFNRYDLKRLQDGVFAAPVTLPVCVSGRHDWLLYLDIDGARFAVPFSGR